MCNLFKRFGDQFFTPRIESRAIVRSRLSFGQIKSLIRSPPGKVKLPIFLENRFKILGCAGQYSIFNNPRSLAQCGNHSWLINIASKARRFREAGKSALS